MHISCCVTVAGLLQRISQPSLPVFTAGGVLCRGGGLDQSGAFHVLGTSFDADSHYAQYTYLPVTRHCMVYEPEVHADRPSTVYEALETWSPENRRLDICRPRIRLIKERKLFARDALRPSDVSSFSVVTRAWIRDVHQSWPSESNAHSSNSQMNIPGS